jgi:tetratricopeptide (TPR) repeat protein
MVINMRILSDENPALEEKIVSIIEFGNSLNTDGDHISALREYEKAWALMPEPKLEWDMIGSWLAGSFYTAYFGLSDFENAKHWAELQLKAENSDIDTAPLIDLGMVCFELGDNEASYRYLDKAYQYGKERAFKERPKKYLDFYLAEKKKH